MREPARFYIFVLALLSFLTSPARADCTNPNVPEGVIIYNEDYRVHQYCNGIEWVALGAVNPAAGGAGCTNPSAPEGVMIYNQDYHIFQYCDGDDWQAIAGGSCRYAPPQGSGYFVLTKGTWNGNLGGRTGADAKCLADLTTNTGWKGYDAANARGQLIASKVHAFICAGGTCASPMPETTYYFANADIPTAGGASFTTDSSGKGPGNSNIWNAADHFGGTYTYLTGRNTGTNTLWSASELHNCSDFLQNAGWTQYGTSDSTTNTRWGSFAVDICDDLHHLVCIVDP